MASSEIAVSTTPPLPGTVLVQQINDAFQAVATQFSGAVDPAAYADAYMLWADTGTGNVKRRNAANSAWDVVGKIFPAGVVSAGAGSALLPSISNDTDLDTGIFFPAANAVAVATGGSERARIDSSGNFLVGTTSNSVTAGGLIARPTNGGAGSSALVIGHANGIASGAFYEGYLYDGNVVGSITQNGTTSVAYNTSSDYRLKENVAPMTGALQTVAALKPCTYTWKADGSAGQGFIAHELQAVVPDCVTGEKDAVEIVDDLDADGKKIGTKEVPRYQGVDTSFLVATLVSAIQEQQTLIADLTTRLEALEAI